MKTTSTKNKKVSRTETTVLDQPLRWFKRAGCDRLKLQMGYPQLDGTVRWEFIKIAYEDPSEEEDFIEKMGRQDKTSRYRINVKNRKLVSAKVEKKGFKLPQVTRI